MASLRYNVGSCATRHRNTGLNFKLAMGAGSDFEGEVLVVIRLARHGAHKAPFYRIVVADQRKKRDGRIIEQIGTYDPKGDPSIIDLDVEKADEWIAKGAQPSERVAKIIASVKGEDLPEKLGKRIAAKTAAKKAADEAAAKQAAEEAAKKAAEEAAAAEEEAAAAEEAAAEDAGEEE